MTNQGPIAIMDYGIGGLGVFRELRRQGYQGQLLYFSDSGHIPYGKLRRNDLLLRVNQIIQKLAEFNPRGLVIACNAASTVADQIKMPTFAVVEIIRFGVKEVMNSGASQVLILGGGRTIRSGIYRRKLESAGITVRQRISQELSILIEAGDIDSAYLRQQITKYTKGNTAGEAVLLACTHYPAAMKIFREVLPFDTKILDPARSAADYIIKKWHGTVCSDPDIFVTTGDPKKMQVVSEKVFGVYANEIRKILLV